MKSQERGVSDPNFIAAAWRRSAEWLSVTLRANAAPVPKLRLACAFTLIVLFAIGIRLLHFQDSSATQSQSGPGMSAIARRYEIEAKRMVEEGRILVPMTPVDPGDAKLILHPPGYPAFIAAIYSVFGESRSAVVFVQIFLDAVSVLLVFLIAAQLFNLTIATIAAFLAALSPHFSNYSLWYSPDTLPVLPILIAVYLIIIASKRPRVLLIVVAGALIGISCWLRANGLLLAPILGLAILLLFEKGKRVRYTAALVSAAVLTISPITIRNWVLYQRFIPISVDGGLAMIEGIGAYDVEGRFGMPRFDGEASAKDVEWHGRSDYAENLWFPDGVERDSYRFNRGLKIVREHPGWFAGVMVRRAFFMLRYDQPRGASWPFTTAGVPPVGAEPPFGHMINDSEMQSAVREPLELLEHGTSLSGTIQTALGAEQKLLTIVGDGSAFGDQFASAPIAVQPESDYVISVSAVVLEGFAAIKVTSADRRITLASAILSEAPEKKPKREQREHPADQILSQNAELSRRVIDLGFATGGRREVLLVVSNNRASDMPPVVEVGDGRIARLGSTPFSWTRLVRPLIRAVQRNLYTTLLLLSLVILGGTLTTIAGRRRAFVSIVAVPIYYLLVHAAVHTEYRYIIAIHYCLFVFGAVSIYCIGLLTMQLATGRQRARVGALITPNPFPDR